MTMIRLDHVSTKDHQIGDRDIGRALDALHRMRAELRHGVAVAAEGIPRPKYALGLSFAVEESSFSKHPDRVLRHRGRTADTFDLVSFSSCSLEFADPSAKDPVVAASEAIDLARTALLRAPACRSGADPILGEAMKGVTWLMRDRLPDRQVRIPDFWLAASPTCSPLISGTEYDLEGPLPHLCCLKVGRTDQGMTIGLSVYTGHCWIERMNAVDGLRAVAALDEWRRSIA